VGVSSIFGDDGFKVVEFSSEVQQEVGSGIKTLLKGQYRISVLKRK
jgi:hypothetical protein